MNKTSFPLKEISIYNLFNGDKTIYEIPIYQRNYAWEKDEIFSLIQDAYNAYDCQRCIQKKTPYYIGTLVTYFKGDNLYEVIDGQQRLTTIFIILNILKIDCRNQLTYRARPKANRTINILEAQDDLNIFNDDIDFGIKRGKKYAEDSWGEIVPETERDGFVDYFKNHVHIVLYRVPRDIDLNHYFEIMNSRGEQLEMSEIVKAKLIAILDDKQRDKFSVLWNHCSEMSVYIQQKYYCDRDKNDFAALFKNHSAFITFDDFRDYLSAGKDFRPNTKTINDILNVNSVNNVLEDDKQDSFQPIIDFPNFLLIILKITCLENHISTDDLILDDKTLLKQFKNKLDCFENNQRKLEFVIHFSYNLIRGRFYLDNYIVHHVCNDDQYGNNPWKLQLWDNSDYGNISNNQDLQRRMVHILSMFEVSYSAKQRKNYLLYCLLYLFNNGYNDSRYCDFLLDLSNKYFRDIYMNRDRLNLVNNPIPSSFDDAILRPNTPFLDLEIGTKTSNIDSLWGDGVFPSNGIPLYVFNFLDYKIWELYDCHVRGNSDQQERKVFFDTLGCQDFGLDFFDSFYFSRTRRSLEHYFPRANIDINNNTPTEAQINCLGNYAMIGSEANSSGSNWSPQAKINRYWDNPQKINQVSIASPKLFIMMQVCKAKGVWGWMQIKEHQEKMLNILLQ